MEITPMFKRALVTGGAGFIGSYLAKALLNDGLEVIILDDLSMGKTENIPEGGEFVK
ncbi:MAG: NAD-dependent epimerase/dehydratase family protein, partial [Candidatus Hermodarchaeota archaeon]